jgi:hypothetical protein
MHHHHHHDEGMMPRPFLPCTAGVCKAQVTVIDCERGQLAVTPDPIPVDAPNNIERTIVTPGYNFDATRGIVVAGPGFTPRGASGNKFIVHDGHERTGYFKYAVNAVREGGGACATYDPYINNR